MKFRSFLLIFLIVFACNFVFAQNDWDKTTYQNWNKEQVKKILTNSPWTKEKDFRQPIIETQQLGMIDPPMAQARLTLRSALTVRQALLRQRQLEAKYDKMSDDEKKKFDQKNTALLECPACKDYYAVSIAYQYLSMDNKNYIADRKKYIYLSNDKGDRRELIEFSVLSQQSSEVVFFFPRRNAAGEELLTAESKKLTFNFELKGMDGKSRFPFEKEEFDISKLIKDGKVVF